MGVFSTFHFSAIAQEVDIAVNGANDELASVGGSYGVNQSHTGYKSPPNPYAYPQCTWYCWGRAYEKLGISLPSWGNANMWDEGADANPNFSVGTEARANSIMVENSSGVGHVMFVEKVENGYAYVTEGNYLSSSYHEDRINLSKMVRDSWTTHQLSPVRYIYLDGGGLNFTPVDVGTDFYANIVCLNSGKVATVSNYNVLLGSKNGDDNQKWRLERQVDTSYKIINVATGYCLDVSNASNANETNIQICPSNDTNAQRWYFKYTGDGLSLVPKCALNSCLDVYSGNIEDGTNIQLFQQNSTAAQIFGLNAQPSFSSINLGRDFTGYIVYNQTGSVVTVDSSENVVVRPYDGTLIQRWNFQRMSDRAYKITNASTGKCLDVAGGSSANKTNIGTYQSNDTAAQRWFVRMNGNGFSFIPKCAVNSAMDLDNGITDNSSNIHEYSYIDNGPHQIFSIQYSINAIEVKEYNDHVYVVYNYEIPWREAYKYCELQGGHLVTINSSGEQKFVIDLLKSTNSRKYLWLGAMDVYSEGKWKWITGDAFSYSNWADGEPNDSNDEDYLMLYRDSGKWNDCKDGYSDFSDSYCFICEFEKKVNALNYTPEKTFDYNEHRYEFYSNNVDWQTAKRFCEQNGGHLVTIASNSENSAIKTNSTGLSRARYWIGLTDIQDEGNWKWITGESKSFTNWESGEPNNSFGAEDYAEFIVSSGKWNDTKGFFCSYDGIGFICEYDTVPKIEITESMVTVNDVVTTSNATSVNPQVTVKVDGKTLTKNRDYTVATTSDIVGGTGTVTVTGKGNYSGSLTKSFKITIDDSNKITDSQGHQYTVNQGEIVTFIINLSSPLQVNHLSGVLYYNQDISEPIITTDMSYHVPNFKNAQFRPLGNGQIEFDVYSDRSIVLNNTMIIKMQFRITAKGGQGWLGHEFREPEFSWQNQGNYGLETYVLTNQSEYVSSLTQPEQNILGDTDGDGEVTILDATTIQRHLASFPTRAYNEKAADADGDKEVTILDATAIQRHLASLPANERIGTLI